MHNALSGHVSLPVGRSCKSSITEKTVNMDSAAVQVTIKEL